MAQDNADPQLDAILVGYENQENLGLRSILACLLAHGYKAELVPFVPGQYEAVAEAFHRGRPCLGGFSLIFQYTLEEFGRLMQVLRAGAVRAHFTAGGHFPSLRPEETLTLLPELDSVVRGEGERTLPELLENLDHADHWERIQGLAFRRGDGVTITAPRPLIEDLDTLPPIHRGEPRQVGPGLRVASLSASRGCVFHCAFCSIRQFYGSAPGPLRRVRSPEAVVEEMRRLFADGGIEFFIFQDDDFATRTREQRQWLDAFLRALRKNRLADKVKWKMSCRVDDLQAETLETMMEHGLIAVYLGVESGSELGLRTLHKGVTVAQNLAAVDLLKRHEMALAIGFMLLDPQTTVNTVRENIDFLQAVGADGYFPVNFCKMLPYAGTPIEAQLRAAGRLCGTPTAPDYRFLDPRLDAYAFLVHRIFTRRNFAPEGLVARLQNADFSWRLTRALGRDTMPADYGTALRKVTAATNTTALETLSTLLEEVQRRDMTELMEEQATLLDLADRQWRHEAQVEIELAKLESMRQPALTQ
jgi:radical SAM superfamily enzyme YgiQ (UPF0313 family)